jgi:hypothetical protein
VPLPRGLMESSQGVKEEFLGGEYCLGALIGEAGAPKSGSV